MIARRTSRSRVKRKDPVTVEMAAEVMRRDTMMTYRWWTELGLTETQITVLMRKRPLCVAPLLDPAESASCSGRSTLDHVKSQPRMGVRAPSDEHHLVSLCEAHHLWSKAGRNWATANRPLLREYIRRRH